MSSLTYQINQAGRYIFYSSDILDISYEPANMRYTAPKFDAQMAKIGITPNMYNIVWRALGDDITGRSMLHVEVHDDEAKVMIKLAVEASKWSKENYIYPAKQVGRGTQLTKLPGGANLGNINDLKFFDKLKQGLKI